MKIIALTGGIACGKTTLANMLRELGAPVIDADAISRSLTAPGGKALPAIREAFGGEVFQDGQTLNRAALAARVFQDPEQLRKLNAVTHPLIIAQMTSAAGNPARPSLYWMCRCCSKPGWTGWRMKRCACPRPCPCS